METLAFLRALFPFLTSEEVLTLRATSKRLKGLVEAEESYWRQLASSFVLGIKGINLSQTF